MWGISVCHIIWPHCKLYVRGIILARMKQYTDRVQIGEYLGSDDSPLQKFRSRSGEPDSLIEPILVAHGKRHGVELEQIPHSFYPFTGKNHIRGELNASDKKGKKKKKKKINLTGM